MAWQMGRGLREEGKGGNGKLVRNTTHGKPQQNGRGLKAERHGEGGDREGRTCFTNSTERLRKDLPFLVLQTKELKNGRQNLKRSFCGPPSPNTLF